MNNEPAIENKTIEGGRSCLGTLGLMLLTVIISVTLTLLVVNYYLFPKQLEPVELNQREETALNKKLRQFGLPTLSNKNDTQTDTLEPESYSETNATREVSFSEKELNAILAKNTNLADKMALDLSKNLTSIRIIIPLDQDFPFMGGKTVKANAGAELAYTNGRPIIVLKGISVWGVPIPNAWLGNLKNVDLVSEFGGDEGFWKSFADGVEDLHVEEGRLIIKLRE